MTPDGKWALTGSEDKTARLWDLKIQKVIIVPFWAYWLYGQ